MRYQILFMSSWFPSKIEPTNGNFVQRHAEAVSLLHNVEILHAVGSNTLVERKYSIDDKMINGIRTLVIYYKNTRNPILNFFRRMKAYNKGFKLLKKPDLVHANVLHYSMLFAVYLKKKFQIPFVITEHWSGFLDINRSKLSIFQLLTARIIANNAAFVLPVSNNLSNNLKKLKLKTKLQVVENVVDTYLFKVKTIVKQPFVFLHISNLVTIKNPEKIINAAIKLGKEFKNFELHIGGDGDLGNLNHLVSHHNAVEFIKTFSVLKPEEVSEKMQRSNCFILFSDYENFPCVLLESLSSGTPAIVTNVGGIPEIINDKNGILINNSESELYDAMKKVLQAEISFEDPILMHEYIATHFSKSIIAEKFNHIYSQILK